MSIISHDDWSLSEKGMKDAERHRKKIDDAIRKNIQDVIAEESIITSKRGKKVRVPVRALRDYRFVYGENKKGAKGGAGQGKTGKGQSIGKIPKKGQGNMPGPPGNQKGMEYIETEVDIDYLIKIMFEDLGLPWIEEKTKVEKLIPKGWRFDSITKKGPMVRIHKRRTMLETIKRTELFVKEIMDETSCTYEQARKALNQAIGDLEDAIEIIQENKLDETITDDLLIEDDDLRFKKIEENVEPHSNAVVIAMMDVSASMDSYKKYLARSMLFWLVQFLNQVYDNVDIKFIMHTTWARIVDEEAFFQTAEWGGTECHTAIDKADYLIETEYPINEWNVYCMYISDGEDFSPRKTVESLERLLDRGINMFGYCEIDVEESPYGAMWRPNNTLIREIQKKWKFNTKQESGTNFYRNDEKRLLLSIIRQKEHIYPSLKHFLFEPARR